MLSKQICIRCYKKHLKPCGHWDNYDENYWNKGYILCPARYSNTESIFNNINNIPDKCPYHLEHIMKEQ